MVQYFYEINKYQNTTTSFQPWLHQNVATNEIVFGTQGKCANILLDLTGQDPLTSSFRWTEAAGAVPMRQYLIPNANSRYLSSQVQRAPGQARGQRGLAHISPSVLAWWIHSSRRMSIAVQKTNVWLGFVHILFSHQFILSSSKIDADWEQYRAAVICTTGALEKKFCWIL